MKQRYYVSARICFLENSRDLIERGFYDLAVFNLEQYCQLMLKYKLLVKTGTYPRTRSFTVLVDILSRIEPSVRVLIEREDYLVMLTKLEDAYISARYLPRRYTELEARAILKFVTEVFRRHVEGI